MGNWISGKEGRLLLRLTVESLVDLTTDQYHLGGDARRPLIPRHPLGRGGFIRLQLCFLSKFKLTH